MIKYVYWSVCRHLRWLYTLNNTTPLTGGQIPLLYLNSYSCVWCIPNICAIKEDSFPFAVITIRCFPHAWLIITGFVTRLSPRVSLVEQELLTAYLMWDSFCSIVNFLCNVLYIIVCLFVHFLYVMVSSVNLWFTASDYSLV